MRSPRALPLPVRSSSVRRYLFAFCGALLVPVLLLAILFVWQFARDERGHVEERARAAAQSAIVSVDLELQQLQALAVTLASSAALRVGNYDRFQQRASEVLNTLSRSETYGVVVRDLTGRQVVNTRQPWGTSLLLVTPSAPVVFRGKMQFDKAASSFLKAVKEAGERKIAFFRIASPGGSANDGIAISRWLRDHKNVRIIVSGACYSACSAAVLYAGADRITITAGGEIGLH